MLPTISLMNHLCSWRRTVAISMSPKGGLHMQSVARLGLTTTHMFFDHARTLISDTYVGRSHTTTCERIYLEAQGQSSPREWLLGLPCLFRPSKNRSESLRS